MTKSINLPSFVHADSIDEINVLGLVDAINNYLRKTAAAFGNIAMFNPDGPVQDTQSLAFHMQEETEHANMFFSAWWDHQRESGLADVMMGRELKKPGNEQKDQPAVMSQVSPRGAIATSAEIIHALVMSIPDEGQDQAEHDCLVLSRIEDEIKNIKRIIHGEEETE